MSLPTEIRAVVERAAARAAATPLWPGFQFEQAPLALCGAQAVWLLGHAAPPPGFEREGELAGRPLHRGVIAWGQAFPADAASVALRPGLQPYHLLSAAFRLRQGEAVAAEEGYPVYDPVNNALAIVENEQLIAALQGDELGLGRFLSVRLHRQKRLGRTGAGEMVAYEQRVEWAEGVPTYLETRAGRPLDELVAHLREANVGGSGAAFERFGWSGAAQALLLDRAAPGWQGAAGLKSLQELLLDRAGQIPAVGGVVKAVGFTAVLEREEQRESARRERV